MLKVDIVRAWKDDAYRRSLSVEELALLPENPAGLVELDEGDLKSVAGGGTRWTKPCASCTVCWINPDCNPLTF